MAGERLIYLPLGGAGEIGMNAYVTAMAAPEKSGFCWSIWAWLFPIWTAALASM